MTKSVRLIPGYLSSDLAEVSTGIKVWWNLNPIVVAGIGVLRLAPNGIDPGPPDGAALALVPVPQTPWDLILSTLGRQLGAAEWTCEVDGYDWRLDITRAAAAIAASVAAESTPSNPATLVGHSTGGLIAVLVYQILAGQGKANLIRRIVTICAPLQGCYSTYDTLRGLSDPITQVLRYAGYAGRVVPAHPGWIVSYLCGIVLSWPSFYQLMPSLIGSASQFDVFRTSLFTASNYPAYLLPSQDWLDYAVDTFEPLMAAAIGLPPAAVMTNVIGTGLSTDNQLVSGLHPSGLPDCRNPDHGDGVTDEVEQTTQQGLAVRVVGAHSSMPLGITLSGLLADLIRDPRVPPAPTPPPMTVPVPVPIATAGPPTNDPVTGLTCIGGHC